MGVGGEWGGARCRRPDPVALTQSRSADGQPSSKVSLGTKKQKKGEGGWKDKCDSTGKEDSSKETTAYRK